MADLSTGNLMSMMECESAARGLFASIADRIGNDAAKRVFLEAAKGPKRKKGRHKPDRDSLLLACYDRDPGASIGELARTLHFIAPGHYGASAEAIDKHIRRLIKARRQADRGYAALDRSSLVSSQA